MRVSMVDLVAYEGCDNVWWVDERRWLTVARSRCLGWRIRVRVGL